MITVQNEKIQDSVARGHEGLLNKRQAKLVKYQNQQVQLQNKQIALEEQKTKLGEPKQRADRDFRKQTIMTFRSLWLENAILAFFTLISTLLTVLLDLEIALELFFFVQDS